MWSSINPIWGMCYRFMRTMDSPHLWKTLPIHGTHSNRHCDKLSWTNQNWQQKIKYCSKKIGVMLASTLSVASTLCTWSRYRIYRARISNSVTKLSHQRCVHNCKKSTVQCCVWKNASNSRKCSKNITTWQPSTKYCEWRRICRRSTINCNAHHDYGNLVFNRDMFLNIPLIADWRAITQRREHLNLIYENLMRENQKRRDFDCATQ